MAPTSLITVDHAPLPGKHHEGGQGVTPLLVGDGNLRDSVTDNSFVFTRTGA
jgi:hypothetical protein